MKKKWVLVLLVLVIAATVFYFVPNPGCEFNEIYASADQSKVSSLEAFRRERVTEEIVVDGTAWTYLCLGEGEKTILFLHGMGGSYDIWWQQIEALKTDYRIISLTYPPVNSLGELARGIEAVLAEEGVESVNLVGSSLGGYLAQYLVAYHPEIVDKAVFANTFPPNDIIREDTRVVGPLLPFLPERIIMSSFRGSIVNDVYPASGNSALVKSYLLEQSHGLMNKAQFIGRYRCVIESFEPADLQNADIDVLIVESDNDPLVAEELREMLKNTYPSADVHTFHQKGHFPYLNEPEAYTSLLVRFFSD